MLAWEVMDHKLKLLIFHKQGQGECWRIQMHQRTNLVACLDQTLATTKEDWIRFNNCIRIMCLPDQIQRIEIAEQIFEETWTTPKMKECFNSLMSLTTPVAVNLDRTCLELVGCSHHLLLSTKTFSKQLRHTLISKEMLKIWEMLRHTRSTIAQSKKAERKAPTQTVTATVEAFTSQLWWPRLPQLLPRPKRRKRRRRRIRPVLKTRFQCLTLWIRQKTRRATRLTQAKLSREWTNRISAAFQLIHTLEQLREHFNLALLKAQLP